MTPSTAKPATGKGPVGGGKQFGTDLHRLYRAGRVHLPDFAIKYAAGTALIHQAGQGLSALRETCPNLLALTYLRQLQEELQEGMRVTAISVHDAGEALVKAAEAYAKSDDDAQAEFKKLMADPAHRAVLDRGPAPGRQWQAPPTAR
ncbi:hypothetical protein [Amycolatopsis sp. EV170708-02-1]|uniref:hypothetical protein n=1 Tax=Amycolatopsis sp. EV170708-02-1 TaxID=2919322 RepID=UPI001F0C8CAE|nr:hypothetical protein [Amycolatopsis sp. EV170708-02-1]UMP00101.1 hypothetical protein MJQ72_26765 [Amycolatopsis sp. EV170708-02-1]